MELLGTIGIDPVLFAAQIINFIVLLWILNRFLFKPIVKKIEDNEKELESAKQLQEELNKEKEELERKNKENLFHLKEKSIQIIKEAEEISKEIKKRQIDEYDLVKSQLLQQTEKLLQSKQKDIQKEHEAAIKSTVALAFLERVKTQLVEPMRQSLSSLYFTNLVELFEKTPIELRHTDTISILHKLEDLSPDLKNNTITQHLQENFSETIGLIELQYVEDLTEEQKKSLLVIIAHKINVDSSLIKLVFKKNEEIVSGYRLEIGGTVIESNLRNALTHGIF
ncbi:hypothetical protein BH09PAT2_BH09PAT2_02910 [soil metagenome]